MEGGCRYDGIESKTREPPAAGEVPRQMLCAEITPPRLYRSLHGPAADSAPLVNWLANCFECFDKAPRALVIRLYSPNGRLDSCNSPGEYTDCSSGLGVSDAEEYSRAKKRINSESGNRNPASGVHGLCRVHMRIRYHNH
jgi:hypothetical protein